MLRRCMSYSYIHEACMSPALNGSSAIRHFKHCNAIEICNRITFDFYTGLPHMLLQLCMYWWKNFIHFVQRKKVAHEGDGEGKVNKQTEEKLKKLRKRNAELVALAKQLDEKNKSLKNENEQLVSCVQDKQPICITTITFVVSPSPPLLPPPFPHPLPHPLPHSSLPPSPTTLL